MLEVYQGSTSESAGIKVGDIITAVNGTNVANMDQDDLRALIDAKKADGVQLSILRGSETLDITVTGGNITVKHVDSALFNDRTGYIYVSMFTGNCADEFENAIKDLKSRNMQSSCDRPAQQSRRFAGYSRKGRRDTAGQGHAHRERWPYGFH